MIQSDTAWISQMIAQERQSAAHIRILTLYVPIVLCAIAWVLRRPRVRTLASPLLSLLWTLLMLVILQRLNLHYHWWTFDPHTSCLLEMPIALYIGWAIFWGLLPQLAWPKLDIVSIAVVAFSFDFLLMVYLDPALDIDRTNWIAGYIPAWLIGEAVAIALVLVPAMLLFRWTENDDHLGLRASGQVVLAALVFLYLIPELVFALRPGTPEWRPLLSTSRFVLQFWAQILLLLAMPGISAVQEFAIRGRGTPLPYDPPRKLVTTGIYRYCANPMQLSCAAVMLVEAVVLRSPWLLAAGAMSTIYSAGLAQWDENLDLARRFDTATQSDGPSQDNPAAISYTTYRKAVPAWRIRWRPFAAGPPATLYVAETCSACRGVRSFLEQRDPRALVFVAAESLPAGSIRRLRYVPVDGPAESGVLALARALEHLNFVWAFAGLLLRLPVIHDAAQLLTDEAGFGPRTLQSTCPTSHKA